MKASRCASRWSQRRARRATSPTSRPSSRAAPACWRNTTPRSTAARPASRSRATLRFLARRPVRSTSRDEIWDAVCRAASAEVERRQETHGLDWWKEHGFATGRSRDADWYLYPTLAATGTALRAALPGTAVCASARSWASACTSTACTGGTSSSPSIRRCRSGRTSRRVWEQSLVSDGRQGRATIRSGC